MAEVLSAPVPAITPVKIEGAPEEHSTTTKPESSDREPHQRDQRQGGYRGRGGGLSGGRGGFRDGGRGGYQRDGGERRGFGRDGGDHVSRGYNQDRGGRGESSREFDAGRSRGSSNAAGRGRGGHRGGGSDFWQSTYREGSRGQRQNRDEPEEEKTDQGEMPDEKQKEPKKFTGRCRLFVGNFANDTEEEEMKALFEKYGECSEIYLNKAKGFGFIRLDTKYNAERAKVELDGTMHKGRVIRVRFATHTAAIRVKNLNPQVSNEVLEEAFSRFGKVERAVVIVDDRGRPTGDGIIEFERKNAAQNAMQKVNEGVFLLTSSPCPITVEAPVQLDEEDGYPEKSINKNPQYHREREAPPRFAAPGSFEFEFGNRWKQLFDMEKLQKEQLEKSIKDAREKMEAEQDQAWHDHQTMLMRQDLMRRQEELRRMEEARAQEQLRRRELEMRRKEEERLREEERSRRELLLRQQQEEMLRRREMMGGGASLGAGLGDAQQLGGGYGAEGLGGIGGGGSTGGSSGMGNVPPRDSLFDATSGGMGGGMANSPAGMPMSDLSDFGPGGGLGGRDMGPRGSDHRRGNSDHRGEGGAVPLRGPPSLPRLDMRRGHDDYPGDSKRRRY